jgi:hypothetical protein
MPRTTRTARTSSIAVSLLATLLAAACAGVDDGEHVEASDAADRTPAERAAPFAIADVGFETPESVLYDEQADVYLVSNINGEPLGKTGNGFISRVRPDGEVEALRWIDGAGAHVTLHAPKGMALKGDTLFVSDIDTVRAFHRTTGAPLGALGVPGASFLNDVTVGGDGALYVSDTGLDASFSPTGRDAVYRFDATGATAIATGEALQRPNGLLAENGAVLMVPFGGDGIYRIPAAGGVAERIATLPAGQLDGIVRAADGSHLVSSWEAGAVYRVAADGTVSVVAEDVEAPADLGWDSRRQRVLIPLFMANRVEVRDVR